MAAGTDLVKPAEYAALAINQTELMEIIEENLSGQQIGEFDLDRIKIPAGGGLAWEVPTLEGTEPKKEVYGVVIYWKEARAFWPTKFEGGNEPPACSAPDGQFAPPSGEPGVPVPTNEAGNYICAQCPNAQFGTAEGGEAPGQACKQTRQLFLLTPDSLIPLVVSLPPTSVAAAKKFMLRLAGHGVKYSAIVTKVSLVKDKNQGGIEYAKAEFSMLERLDEEAAMRVGDMAKVLRPIFEQVEVRQDEVSEPEDAVEV
jgi:hypothetical protein